MSRAGKPTGNPVNEALNGWIKEDLYMDSKLGECRSKEQIRNVITAHVSFYTAKRPCYTIGYDTPDNYYRRSQRGEIPSKKTFKDRVLCETPRFVQERKVKQV